MLGEYIFGFDAFDINPTSSDAGMVLRNAVYEKHCEIKSHPDFRNGALRIGGIWPRGDQFYFEVFPTSKYEGPLP